MCIRWSENSVEGDTSLNSVVRQGSNTKRIYRGGNGQSGGNPRRQTNRNNGSAVKVNGNARQVMEKYLALAREATTAGDRITAEGYFQHAEHYYRVLNANGRDVD
jgi:hypothetical protein